MGRERRLDTLRASLEGGEGFLVSSPENVRYLSGFTGSSASILMTRDRAVFLTDFRYLTQSEEQVSGMEREIYSKQVEGLAEVVRGSGISRLKFEAGSVRYGGYEELRDALEGLELVPTKDVVEDMRHVKDEEEVAAIRRAVELTARAWEDTLGSGLQGTTERALSLDLEFRLKRMGSEKSPFDFIVASGPRGALPHGKAADRVIGGGELVTFDFGACVDGYFSDLTRTVSVGPAPGELEGVYEIVLEANRAGLSAVRPGVRAEEVDAAARSVIEEAGHGEHFGHGTGHGVGLEVHENLRIAKGQERELVSGMVFTVEPGIYVPGVGGVRIEDMVLVTEGGAEVLTAGIAKELVAVA